jgi:hypothetical protein
MGGARMSHSHGNQGGGNYFVDPQTNFLRGGPGGHQGPSGSGKHGGHMGGEGPMNNMGMMNNNNNNGGFYNQN